MERNIFATTDPVPSSTSISSASEQTAVPLSAVPQPAVTQLIPSTGENAQHAEQKGATPPITCAGGTPPAGEEPPAGETPPAGEKPATQGTDGHELTMEGESTSPYSPDNLILYHTSLGLFERLEKRGVITRDDYRQAVRILTERYGFPENSIFAEGA